MTTLYVARWVAPVSSPPIADGGVAVDNGVIVAVGAQAEVRNQLAPLGALQTVDLGDAVLCPGFVNVHAHLELTAMRGFLEDLSFFDWIRKLTRVKYERMRPVDLQISAKWGALESLRAGITTIGDTGDSGAAMDALTTSGQRGVVYQEVFGPEMLEAKKNLSALKRKVDALRRQETSLVKTGVSPHAPYTVSTLLLRLTTEYASHENLPMCMHVAESQSEEDFMRQGMGPFAERLRAQNVPWSPPGVSTIRYLSDLNVLRVKPLLIHCVRATEEDIGLLTFWGARVAHCPKSNAKFGHGIAPALQMRKRGVAVGLGTDSVASNNVCDLLDEARFAGLLNRASNGDGKILPATELLEWMTLGGARALGLEGRIGTLDVGKDADMTAVSLSASHLRPVHDPVTAMLASGGARDVSMTMVRGKILYDGQQIFTLDESRLRTQVQDVAMRLA
jgi:5-methylthioadenosine/S-adenosylhomocysteine deaminase